MRLNVFTKLVMVQMSVSLFSPGAINRTWRKRVWRLSNNWGSGPHLQSYKPVKMKFSIFSKLIFCSLEARIGWVWSCDTKRSHSSNRDVKMLDVIFWGKSKEFPMLIQSKRGSQFCLTIWPCVQLPLCHISTGHILIEMLKNILMNLNLSR